jgi:hypothetical protein
MAKIVDGRKGSGIRHQLKAAYHQRASKKAAGWTPKPHWPSRSSAKMANSAHPGGENIYAM